MPWYSLKGGGCTESGHETEPQSGSCKVWDLLRRGDFSRTVRCLLSQGIDNVCQGELCGVGAKL